jgi:hypothetical protein
MIFKDIHFIKNEGTSKKEESTSSIKASQVFTSLLSDDNAAASNRAEQGITKEGDTGDFTNFDTVDYEIGKRVVTYNIEDLTGKVDKKSVTV